MNKTEKLIKEHDSALSTAIVFHKAERTIRSIENQAFKEMDLTPTQFAVLETLYSKGDLRIQDLIDRMLATSGNMTVVIKNMVRDGYIQKECDPADRRSFLVSLTEKGRKKMETVLPLHIETIQSIMSVLSTEEQGQLRQILKKFKDLS